MKRRLYILWSMTILSLVMRLCCIDESWKAQEPKNSVEVAFLKERSERELLSAQKQKEEFREKKDTAQEKEADLRIARAQYNLKTADIAQRLQERENPEIAVEQKNILDKEITTLQAQRAVDEKLVATLTQDLSVLLNTAVATDMLANLSDRLNAIFNGSESISLKNKALDKILRTNTFDQKLFLESVEKESNFDKKISLLRERRILLADLQSKLENEINQVLKLKNAEYAKKLNSVKEALIDAMDSVDKKSLREFVGKEQKQRGFFARMARTFNAWFERVFRFPESQKNDSVVSNLINEIDTINKQIYPLTMLSNSLNTLQGNVADLQERFNRLDLTDEVGRGNFKKEVMEMLNQLNVLEKSFTPQDKSLIDEAYQHLQEISGDMQAYVHRYPDPKRYAVLFDSLTDFYQGLFGSNDVENIYKFLGLDSNATREDILKADEEYSKKFVKGDPIGDRARNAGYILRNPVSKETYDAFVKDSQFLRSRGIDPFEAVKTEEYKAYLTDRTRSSLAALQVTEQMADALTKEIGQLYVASVQENQPLISGVAGKEDEFPPFFTDLGLLRKQLEYSLEKLN